MSVVGRTIYDSRGQPTVECDLVTELGKYRAAVPSGASTGIHEAHELRDGGQKWNGKGVTKAVASINEVIGPAVEVIKSSIGTDTVIGPAAATHGRGILLLFGGRILCSAGHGRNPAS